MTSFDKLPYLGERLAELTTQLISDKLSKEELAELEKLSRNLYERAVILNYKAKEESVYNSTVEVEKVAEKAVDASFPYNQTDDTVVKETSIENKEELQEDLEEETQLETSADLQEEEATKGKVELDSPKDEATPASEERVQFDFSGGFNNNTISTKEKTHPVEETKEEKQKENTSVEANHSVEIESDTEAVSSQHNEEPEEDLSKTDEPAGDVDETPSTSPIEEEKPSLDEVLTSTVVNDSVFYQGFMNAYNVASGDRLGAAKINSLKEAIGLNDKLQFINELFNGDATSYNEAIEHLNQFDSHEGALERLSELAEKENWEKENPTVDEFAHFVIRRYVQ